MDTEHENLYQMHFQLKRDMSKTRLIAQNIVFNAEEMRAWSRSLQKRYPLPDGYMWMCCNWDSEHFVKAAA